MKSEILEPINSNYHEPNQNHSKQKDIRHWSEEEHQQYVQFLLKAKSQGHSQRNSEPLFKRMSQIIGTRTPSQCRSHHQKFNPFNPNLRRIHKIQKIPKIEKTILRSKQIIRQYFFQNKVHSEDEYLDQ